MNRDTARPHQPSRETSVKYVTTELIIITVVAIQSLRASAPVARSAGELIFFPTDLL
jgi:hypothetical protein